MTEQQKQKQVKQQVHQQVQQQVQQQVPWYHDPSNALSPFAKPEMMRRRAELRASDMHYLSAHFETLERERCRDDALRIADEFVEKTCCTLLSGEVRERWAPVMELRDLEDFACPPYASEERILAWLCNTANLRGVPLVVREELERRGFLCGISRKNSRSGTIEDEPLEEDEQRRQQQQRQDNDGGGQRGTRTTTDATPDPLEFLPLRRKATSSHARHPRAPRLVRFLYASWDVPAASTVASSSSSSVAAVAAAPSGTAPPAKRRKKRRAVPRRLD